MISFIPVRGENTPVNVQVNDRNVQVEAKNVQVDAQVKSDPSDRILAFCVAPKTLLEIANHLGYKDRRSARKLIDPLLEEGRMAMTVPDKPNSRFQKFITIK